MPREEVFRLRSEFPLPGFELWLPSCWLAYLPLISLFLHDFTYETDANMVCEQSTNSTRNLELHERGFSYCSECGWPC